MPNVVKHVAQCPQLTIKTNYMATALRIAILLEFAAEADAQGFVRIPLNDRFSSRQIELLQRRDVTLSPAVDSFLQHLQSHVRTVQYSMAMDHMMVEPARFVASVFASEGLPSYEYRFSYVADSMRSKWPGAPHATEIPYVFDTVSAKYGKDLTPSDERIAQAMNSYWVAFAKTGDPSTGNTPAWPRYSPATDMLMDFTAEGPVAEADPWKARLDVMAAYVSSSVPPTMPRASQRP